MTPNVSDETRSIFVTGLRNAHAMEKQALSIMEPQVSRVESYPDVVQRLKEHIRETEGQIRRLETVLEGLGESSSSLKDMALSMVGGMAAIGHSMASDEILKNSLANFAFENYEIAAYTSLVTIADAAGFKDASAALAQNLAEERGMADWLDKNLPKITLQFAQLREMGEQASR
jgi:ferritin-like metal-binding protein YciE